MLFKVITSLAATVSKVEVVSARIHLLKDLAAFEESRRRSGWDRRIPHASVLEVMTTLCPVPGQGTRWVLMGMGPWDAFGYNQNKSRFDILQCWLMKGAVLSRRRFEDTLVQPRSWIRPDNLPSNPNQRVKGDNSLWDGCCVLGWWLGHVVAAFWLAPMTCRGKRESSYFMLG